MFHHKLMARCLAVFACLAGVPSTPAQLGISGVTDRTVYANTVTFMVSTQAGYSYGVYLNHKPVPAGVPTLVNQPDFYELVAYATNQTTSAVTEMYRRFIVEDTSRAGTELGLPSQTPWPVILSASNEFAGAHLRLIAPQNFPTGYQIPVVAWVLDDAEHAVRANGVLSADGHPAINLKRGVGSGFLAATHPAGPLNYNPSVQGLQTNKAIQLEGSTTWTSVSGTLGGAVNWPANSRIAVTTNLSIPAGSTLTIGEGTIVRLNARVNITNLGNIIINGTIDRPVVFMPASPAQPWGGFFFPANTSQLNASGTIFTYSGAGRGFAGHRNEQHLFSLDNNSRLTLTDCAAIYLDGQFGHGFDNGQPLIAINLTRTLVQRCTTGGEYTGASFTVNDCAFIEFPDDTANFVNGDNDALYIVTGTHSFTNTLFGWTKDDGIDSGGDGAARLHYERCWFEAIFHEGNSLSGRKDVTAHQTVFWDCGQGMEDGYGPSGTTYGPTGRVDNCLFVACKSGVRHGDNYPSIGNGYPGFITATNSIFLHNHRDVFAFNWRTSGGWTNNYGQCFASSNLFTIIDTNFPNNTVWNPMTDAARLGPLGGAGRVGIGFAARPGQTAASLSNGIPVGLSRFCTNQVSADYMIEGTDGLATSGTIVFPPGLTRAYIPYPGSFNGVLRVALINPQNAEITGGEMLFQNLPVVPTTNVTLVSRGSRWNYDDSGVGQSTGWRSLDFDDSSWSNGLAQLGYADGDEVTPIRRVVNNVTNITLYFRQRFQVTNLAAQDRLNLWMLRDDGGVVYLNGNDVYRSPSMPQPPTTVTYTTLATNQSVGTAPPDNTVDTTNLNANLLVEGMNILAVEIHQHRLDSSDASFDFELTGVPVSPRPTLYSWRMGNELWLAWSDATFALQDAGQITGAWSNVSSQSPVIVHTSMQQRFFRLRKP